MSLKSGCYRTPQHGRRWPRINRILPCSLRLDLLLLNSSRWWHSPPLNSPMRSFRLTTCKSGQQRTYRRDCSHSRFHVRYSNTGVCYIRLHPEPLPWSPSKIRPYVIHTLLDCGTYQLNYFLPFFFYVSKSHPLKHGIHLVMMMGCFLRLYQRRTVPHLL